MKCDLSGKIVIELSISEGLLLKKILGGMSKSLVKSLEECGKEESNFVGHLYHSLEDVVNIEIEKLR